MLINPNHISESSNARKKPPSLFHVHGLWCIVPFLFLLFDDPRFNFHDAKLMYANGRLIHAGRETSEDSNNGDAFLRHTRKHREERRKRLSTFGKAHRCSRWMFMQAARQKAMRRLIFRRHLTVHESVGEDHDGVVEVAVLLFDDAQRRSLFVLGRVSWGDARRQVDYHHVCVCEGEKYDNSNCI